MYHQTFVKNSKFLPTSSELRSIFLIWKKYEGLVMLNMGNINSLEGEKENILLTSGMTWITRIHPPPWLMLGAHVRKLLDLIFSQIFKEHDVYIIRGDKIEVGNWAGCPDHGIGLNKPLTQFSVILVNLSLAASNSSPKVLSDKHSLLRPSVITC